MDLNLFQRLSAKFCQYRENWAAAVKGYSSRLSRRCKQKGRANSKDEFISSSRVKMNEVTKMITRLKRMFVHSQDLTPACMHKNYFILTDFEMMTRKASSHKQLQSPVFSGLKR